MAKHDWADLVPLNNDGMQRQLSPQSHQGRAESLNALGSHKGGGGRRHDTEVASTGLSAVDTGSHTLDFVEHCGNMHKAEHLTLKHHKG